MAKKILRLAAPLFLFFLLFVPYSYVNEKYIVEWFGCGCPKTDAAGNIIHSYFNANDFTLLFWLFITLCALVVAFFLSKGVLKKWGRAAYLFAILILSLGITYIFYQLLMWN